MLFPIIRKYWKLLLATMLITAVGCAFTIGLSGAYLTLEQTMNDYLAQYGYPDASVTTEVTNKGILDAIRKVPGVRVVNARLCADTVVQDQDGRYLSVRVFSFSDDDVEQFYFHESVEGDNEYTMFLEYQFAEANGIHAGDTLSVRVGDEWKEAFVGGLVSKPETLAVQPTNDSWDTNADFGYAYASVHILEAEYQKVYGDAKGKLDDKGNELDVAKKDAKKKLKNARKQLDEASGALKEMEELLASSEVEASEKRQELIQTRDELLRKRAELVQTREELLKKRAELYQQREQLVAGRSTAQKALSELEELLSQLQKASDGLASIDEQVAAVIAQLNVLQGSEAASAIELLQRISEDVQVEPLVSSITALRQLITSAEAYGFYYGVSDTVENVAASLRDFLDGVEADASYLSSEEVVFVIGRIQNGDEDVKDTDEYQRAASVVSKYVPVLRPEDLPASYEGAVAATNEILSVVSRTELDAALERLASFDIQQTVEELTATIDGLLNAMTRLESAMNTSFSTVGEIVAAYYDAISELEVGKAELQNARGQIVEALEAQGVTEGMIPSTMSMLSQKIETLKSTIGQIDEGLPQIDEGLRQIDEGLPQIDDGLQQIDEGLPQIEEGLAEIDRRLSQAKNQLDEAKSALEERESEYQKTAADSRMEFANLDEELAKAYAELDENQGYDQLCNQFQLWFDDDVDSEETLQAVEVALGDVVVKSDVTFARSIVKNRIDVNLKPIGTMSTFIPAIYFSVLLVIVFLFMSLIIRQCRREIGILRALGFTVGSIRRLFCGVNLAVSLAAIVLGLGLGMALAWYVGVRYTQFFVLPFMSFKVDWTRALIAFALAIVVGQLATLFSAGIVARISPAEAMSRPAPVTVHVNGALGKLMQKLSPMTSFSITTIFRNPVRFFFSSVCVAATIMLIYSSLAFFTSMDFILTQTFGNRIRYDCQIFYSKPVTKKTLKGLRSQDYLQDVTSMPYYKTTISFNGTSESALVSAVDGGTDLVGVTNKEGQELSLDLSDNGILLEEHLANQIGAQVGNEVLVDGRIPMRVEGISYQCISRSQYISPKGAEQLGDEAVGCVICRIDQTDEQKLLGYLVEQDDYLYAVFTRLSYEGTVKQLKSYEFAAWIIVGFAISVGSIVVLNTSRTNILEKKKELCILRTLGFQHGEISKSWFSQSIVQYVLAVVMGFPLGGVVARITLERLSTDTREYAYANTPKELLITALFVFAYILLSHFVAIHDMKKWDMVETVKEKE